jgi:hypothetical protein
MWSAFVGLSSKMKGNIMRLKTCTLGLSLLASVALLPSYAFAVEPDVDSPAGPQNAAPTARPDFQADDQAGQQLNPQAEGANPSQGADQMPRAEGANEIPRADAGANPAKSSPGEENKGRPKVE